MDRDSAIYYLKESRKRSEAMGSKDLMMRTLFQEILFAQRFNEPLQHVAEIESFYNEIAAMEEPNVNHLVQLAEALNGYYEQQGDFEQSNRYAHFLIRNLDKISEDRVKGKLFELERKYDVELKEKTILKQEQKLSERNRTIFVLIAIVVIVLMISGLLFVWNKYRHNLKEKNLSEHFTAQMLLKTEEERKRIASDLHDSVSNELVNLRHAIENSQYQLKDKVDTILDEVRSISRNLSPTLFDKVGLSKSVEQLAEKTQQQEDFFLTADINYSGVLSNPKELQIYRIIQESVTNMIKHAEAHAGKITISETQQQVIVEIKDNGKGFDVQKMLQQGNCFGLLNITERAKYINAQVEYKSSPSGTIILLTIPK